MHFTWHDYEIKCVVLQQQKKQHVCVWERNSSSHLIPFFFPVHDAWSRQKKNWKLKWKVFLFFFFSLTDIKLVLFSFPPILFFSIVNEEKICTEKQVKLDCKLHINNIMEEKKWLNI